MLDKPLTCAQKDVLDKLTEELHVKDAPDSWCQWVVTRDGNAIKWDENEKFYDYLGWLQYIIEKYLVPWGYVLNGSVTWQGEDPDDIGEIHVKNNIMNVKRGRVIYEPPAPDIHPSNENGDLGVPEKAGGLDVIYQYTVMRKRGQQLADAYNALRKDITRSLRAHGYRHLATRNAFIVRYLAHYEKYMPGLLAETEAIMDNAWGDVLTEIARLREELELRTTQYDNTRAFILAQLKSLFDAMLGADIHEIDELLRGETPTIGGSKK